jgi:hypothetical protein
MPWYRRDVGTDSTFWFELHDPEPRRNQASMEEES